MIEWLVKFDHNNISPLDNRYSSKINDIKKVFSEYSLVKTRFIIEINWLLYLCDKKPKYFNKISNATRKKIIKFRDNFDDKSVIKIKKIEQSTNHDVKAVEYFIRDFFKKDKTLSKYIHLIHFGLTSEDVNSLSYAIMLKDGLNIYTKDIVNINKILTKSSKKWKSLPLLSRTHGQAASPTTVGKELKVFSNRIDREIIKLRNIYPLAKFSGAVGNYHAFDIAVDNINWPEFNSKFIKTFNVHQNLLTTQIEPHDWIAEMLQIMTRLNNICIDLSQDMWIYISNEIFKLKLNINEVGSSTMPHKVNPIDFENAEGNLGVANSTFNFFSNKLTKSRLQRDLSDSTVLRNIGVPFSHTIISIESILKGLSKIYVNKDKINNDIEDNWIVVSEAIQTILRREGYPQPYEVMKELTRNNEKIDKSKLHNFIDSLNIDQAIKKELKKITPYNYTGI